MRLSENFKTTEFDCKGKGCCEHTSIDLGLVDFLQKIRDHFGKAVTINSAYRCPAHNKSVGGASKSMHLSGKAADIKVKGVAPEDVAAYAEEIGMLGIGLYSWGCHVDTRSAKFFWKTDKQTPVDTFLKNDKVVLPVLKKGNKSQAVKTVQILLSAKGYTGKKDKPLALDGDFGANTEFAVKNFQKNKKIKENGVVDADMWCLLIVE